MKSFDVPADKQGHYSQIVRIYYTKEEIHYVVTSFFPKYIPNFA